MRLSKTVKIRPPESLQNLSIEQWEEYASDVAMLYHVATLWVREVRRDPREGEVKAHMLRQAIADRLEARKLFGVVFQQYQRAGGCESRSWIKVCGQNKYLVLLQKLFPSGSSLSKP